MNYRPTLRQLSYLLALEKARNFSKAAGHCHVTQSTLSAGIRELEAHLGIALVERGRRYQGLTPAGAEVAARGREILALSDDLVRSAASRKQPLSGDLRLGAIPTIGPFLLPQAVSFLAADFPVLKLLLREAESAELLVLLASGALDAVLMAFPYPAPGLEIEIIARDQIRLLVSAADPLARRKHIDAEELVGKELLLLEDGHCLRDHALAVCRLHGISRPPDYEGTSLLTLALMVEMGRGYTLVPDLALEAGLIRGLRVKAVSIGRRQEGRDIGLVWRKSSPRGDEFRLLAAGIRNIVGGPSQGTGSSGLSQSAQARTSP